MRYSSETKSVSDDHEFAAGGWGSTLLVKNSSSGLIKVKNPSLRVVCGATGLDEGGAGAGPIFFCVVYVPEATLVQQPHMGLYTNALSFYEPNQNVIIQGVLHPDGDSQTFRTRLARNLNPGDEIHIVYCSGGHQRIHMAYTFNYAIGFN